MKTMKPNNDVAFIDGSMDLGAASPIENEIMQEAKRKKIVMNESELRNYIYKKVLKVLNEDAPMDPAAAPLPPAGGAAPLPGAAPMPGMTPPADDADRANLPGAAKTAKDKADKFKDQNGGAKGFNPQEDEEDDDDKKKDKDKDDK